MSNKQNKKRNIILVLILILLVGIYYLVKVFDKKESNIPNTLIMVNSKDIHKIEITLSGKSTNVIEKQNDNKYWKLYDKNNPSITFVARQKDVDFVLKSIDELKPEEFTSMDTTNRNRYWSSDTTGSRTRLYDKKGKIIADFFVGRTQFRQGFSGRDQNSSDVVTYVRRADDDKIFAVSGFLNSFNKDLDGWKEKILWTFKPEEVVEINYTHPNKDYQFAIIKKDNQWFMDEKQIENSTMDNYLFHLSYKEGFEGNDQEWDQDFEYQIKIKTNTNEEFIVSIHKLSDENFILKSNINPNYLLIKNETMVNEFFKPKSFFFEKKNS